MFPDSRQAEGGSQDLTIGGGVTGFPREWEGSIRGDYHQDGTYTELIQDILLEKERSRGLDNSGIRSTGYYSGGPGFCFQNL